MRILTQILLCLVPAALCATSTNVPAGFTGGYGEPTCVACHTGVLNPPSGSVAVTVPTVYTPGLTQTLQVVITDPGAAAWGFELSARFTNGNQAGAFTPSNTVAVKIASSVQYAAQASPGTLAGKQFQFNVSWTAPPDTTGGAVVFDVAGLAANASDGTPNGRTYSAEARSASAPPAVNTNGVVSAASYQAPVSEGQLISIFGQNLSAGGPYAAGLPLPPVLGGVQVVLAGMQCPIVYVSPAQINAQIPYGISPGEAPLYVQINNTPGPSVQVTLAAAAPAVFTASSTGTGPGAILHPDYSAVTATHPAASGETVLIFATGLGATSPAVLAGAAAPASPGLSKTVETVTVTIGGSNAPVSFSGLAPGFAGLYQINAVIPPSVSGIVDVLVTAGAVTSCSCATVQIQ